MKRPAVPAQAKDVAHAAKTGVQPQAPRISERSTGESAAPRLPHILPHPSAEPTSRPPMSWTRAQVDGTEKSVAIAAITNAPTTDQAVGSQGMLRKASTLTKGATPIGRDRPHRS